ncbi:hypothetical protein HMPREF9333_00832 [Johnsonella ignava ATCC 51276]|uniref:Probable multidrug resistance protein NorM n=2 Tax=Johnsonella TaxID=43994 RepID=G5GGZ2_9FIRM|nr:MATE family efflux transporter [Johnsonella ignava]EHI56050.1 hypothetical protein HMPREF9333_00832 [Johnsonella ignava ATCC 51276]
MKDPEKKLRNNIKMSKYNKISFSVFSDMIKDISFLKRMLGIAVPVTLQNLLNMIVNMLDTIMIGSLGTGAIAAVGLGNKVYFVFALLVFGISSGTGLLSAQYWGNKDVKSIRKVLGIGLLTAVSASFIFSAAAFFIPEILMKIFTESPETVNIGISYLTIVCFSYPFTAVTNIHVYALRATGQVTIPVITSISAIIINITANYMLIFGNFGMPALGVQGAAYATLIARAAECIAVLLIIRLKKSPLVCSLKEMFSFGNNIFRQFLVNSTPVIANELMWGLGITIYSIAYGRMGDNAVAAVTVATTFTDITLTVFMGLAAASVVILGNEMGADHLEKAKKYASYFYILSVLMGVFASIICLLAGERYSFMFNISDKVRHDVVICFLMHAFLQPFVGMSTVNLVGILRSGGDTKASFLIDISGVWLIGVPLAFIGGLVLKVPVYIVYAMVTSEEIYKTILGYIRYRKYKWLKNLTTELN